MKVRLRQGARLLGAALVVVAVAVAAGAAVVYATGSSGMMSCVPAAPASPDPIPRWVMAAGIPALAAAFVGAFFALAGGRVLTRLIGLVLTAALAAATFYAVYSLLPAACRP